MTWANRLLRIFNMRTMAEVLNVIDNQRLTTIVDQLELMRHHRLSAIKLTIIMLSLF